MFKSTYHFPLQRLSGEDLENNIKEYLDKTNTPDPFDEWSGAIGEVMEREKKD